eukprot:TRINITY_DN27835_c0_g1_i1.p1 TRINITY_DN27835_c0_g1~~TRINITY_DN27835_c0_g1_i1.p1  ORF type:complete len:240 (+),score=91.50 TRINITY_DN27835_c0_g1_i1:97-720(+)
MLEEEKARTEELELENELRLIEEEEELKRVADLENIQLQKRKDIDHSMTTLDQSEREDFLRDLMILEELTDMLETSTERLEKRKQQILSRIELEEERQLARAAQQKSVLCDALKGADAVKAEELKVRKETFLDPITHQRSLEEAAVLKQQQYQQSLAVEAQRRALRNTLSEIDNNHLNTLSPSEQEHILDEMFLLQSLREKTRKLLG